MTFLNQLLIAVIQGVTEFLPISSSGHLILIPYFTDFTDQGPLIDVAVHIGSLLAIIIYFFRDVRFLAIGGFASVGVIRAPAQRRAFTWIAIGTIPAVLLGLFFYLSGYLESFRSTSLIGFNLIIYGLLLGAADRWGKQERYYEDINLKDAIFVGLAQALALIPGTSRAGVTMTASRALGFHRAEAARFSFLLSIPAVAAAGLLATFELASATREMQSDAIIAGALTFVAAFATMAGLMRFLKTQSMMVFVLYRVILGGALLAFF